MNGEKPRPENLKNTPIAKKPVLPKETGGRRKNRPDPVRYGDWENNGKCVDF